MIVQNAGGKDFEPDPLLDIENEYEARVLGVIHIGKHQKQKHDGTNFIDEYDEIEQAIIEYEIVEEGTQVERGPEDAKRLENRRMCQFIKFSSHEKSGLFKLAKSINPKAAYMNGKKGEVDTSLIVGLPVYLGLKLNKAGDKTNIREVLKVPSKLQESFEPLTNNTYLYSVDGGAFAVQGKETKLSDVPKWMLEFALNKAINADQFAQIDEIEAHLEELNSDKPTDTELEGDRLPPKEDKKAEPKKEKVEEQEPEAEAEEKVEEKAKEPAKRTRRSRASKEDKIDYSAKTIEELEALVVEKGVMTDEDLDELNDNVDSDEEFKAGIIAKLEA